MLTLGLNVGTTRSGKRLKDGGVCIIQDGYICGLSEERVTRVKHAGGYDCSLAVALNWLGAELADFDAIVVSSCCESVPTDKRLPGLAAQDTTLITYVPSHHLSHAYSAFFVSPFEEALIAVADAGGNVIGPQGHAEWWRDHREQSSYYIGRGDSICLIGRDFDQPMEAGLGEVYRAFTYYLGWHSSTFSANTMALAAYGDPEHFAKLRLFEFDGRHLKSRLINNPVDPVGMVSHWACRQGAKIPEPRDPRAPLSQSYVDLAAFIQRELEEALIRKITFLSESTGIRQLCIAGGVGLNCVANRRILDETPIERIFIQPASGDSGQAFGNALYGYHYLLDQPRVQVHFSPYLGLPYDLSLQSLERIVSRYSPQSMKMTRMTDATTKVAEMLSQGKVLAWYQGRSEYGPRALGNRSILADPRSPAIRERCHEIKKREFFRPFAPSVLEERAQDYFDIEVPSPYMLLIAKAKPHATLQVPAVLHTDSTARLQTVSRDDNPLFYDLLLKFEHITGIPMILNTSFNRRGEPMVETPNDALNTFYDLDLDGLVMGDVLVERCHQPSISVSIPYKRDFEYAWVTFDRDKLARHLARDFPGFQLVGRSILGLYSEYVQLLREDRKSTTIRYRHNAIEYPMSDELPLLNTGSNGRNFEAYPAGKVRVNRLAIKRFDLLNDDDAQLDGFCCKDELQHRLREIYGHIDGDNVVTIYHIKLCSGG